MTPKSRAVADPNLPGRVFPFLAYVFRRLSPRSRAGIYFISFLTASAVAVRISMSYGFKMLIDGLQAAGQGGNVWEILSGPFYVICGGFLFFNLAFRLRAVMDGIIMPDTLAKVRGVLVAYMLEHSHSYFHNRLAGELASKVDNVVRGWQNMVWFRLQFGMIPAVFAVLSAGALIWPVDSGVVYLLAAAVGAIVFLAWIATALIRKSSAIVADRESDIAGQIVDVVTNVDSVKGFGQVEEEFALLGRLEDSFSEDYRKLRRRQTTFWGLAELAISLLVVGVIWRLIDNWQAGQATLGDVTMCVAIMLEMWWRLIEMMGQLIELSNDTGRFQAALNEIVRPHDVADVPGAPSIRVTEGGIVFRDVGFVYASGHRVFEGLNLVVKPAEKVGIVGLSGAGKTTLCRLLLRHYDIQEGQITLDGHDVRAVTQDSLRQQVAVIPQEPMLFHRTLAENIRYGRPDAAPDEIVAAAVAAQADAFIEALPEKYDTLVGERGVKLSGGQRQRISIARAILKDAPVLILDEATSALDSKTERQIQAALAKAMEGRTTLVIAHRLSTLAHLDRLVVLKDGKVVEEGTLAELLAAGGHFAELWRFQADGFLPDSI